MGKAAGGEGATRIYIRDDDVGDFTPELAAFVSLFADRNLPVSYQIIPELFTEACATALVALRARAPELVEFGQHGLRHHMMLRGRKVNFEFGPQRTYDEQLSDILAGRELLLRRLGDQSAAAVFTPPRHRFDRNTLRAVKTAGFSVLSSSSYPTLPHRLAYGIGRALGLTNLGPPAVSWHGRVRPDCGLFEASIAVSVDNGATIAGSVDAVMKKVAQARRHTAKVGLMFHHAVYKGSDGQAFLEQLVDRLVAAPNVRFERLSRAPFRSQD